MNFLLLGTEEVGGDVWPEVGVVFEGRDDAD